MGMVEKGYERPYKVKWTDYNCYAIYFRDTFKASGVINNGDNCIPDNLALLNDAYKNGFKEGAAANE